jgi:hypothetical protein
MVKIFVMFLPEFACFLPLTTLCCCGHRGFFAGKDIPSKTPIGYGDVAIHTFHLMANQIYANPENGAPMDDLDDNPLANIVDWFEQYIWVPHGSGGQFEILEHDARIVTAIPGGGVVGGYNPKMTNADWNHSSAYHREAWNEYPGVAHPGRGAYSNYFNVELASTEHIPAGKEIFLNYGDNWEEKEDGDKEKLTKDDFVKVDKTIQKMIEFFDKYESDLDDASKGEIYKFLVMDVLRAAAGKSKGKQLQEMLPSNPADLKKVLEDGGSFYVSSPGSIRSLKWLETNGRCMDNIRPGPSTIPYAGRGAFATRPIKEGSLVAPVPLVQIPEETILNMHPTKVVEVPPIDADSEEPDQLTMRASDEPTGLQLLFNYVYGHPDSNLVFLPAGASVNYINHSKEKVNAKLVWSDHPFHQKEWFNLSPLDLIAKENAYLGLMMEIVATRDIQEGEEIFLDYGDRWQAAWDVHVADFEEGKPKSWPLRALDLNQEHRNKLFRTKDQDPYPGNVMMKCFLMVKKPKEGQPLKDKEGRKLRVWSEADSGKPNLVSENLFDCEILTAEETPEGNFYDVAWSNGQEVTVVQKVPQKAIVFLDKPETGDQHFAFAFRHYIEIPDDMFPAAWRNDVESEKE